MWINIITLVIAAAAFVSSIVVPYLTTKEANKHQKKMFILSFYLERQSQAFSKFLEDTNTAISAKIAILDMYRKSFASMLLFLPKRLHQEAHDLNDLVINKDFESAAQAYKLFAAKLCDVRPGEALPGNDGALFSL